MSSLLAKRCFSLAGHKLASLYIIITCWPSVLVVGSSGLQASGDVCMVHGMHARRGTRCAHA